MDILKFISDYVSNEKVQRLIPLFTLLAENSFDIKKVMNNLSLETLAPIVESLFENKTSRENSGEVKTDYFKPIRNISNSEIIDRLNRYFAS